MSLTESTMMKLGTQMPEFALPSVADGSQVSSEDFVDMKGMLVMFISNHCPYVQHVAEELGKMCAYYDGSGLGVVAISPNDIENYPDDAPSKMRDMAEEHDFGFPILYDKSQEVAQDFTAACTPDFFLFDKDCKLVYRGQLDESRPENGIPVTGEDLRAAIDALLEGKVPKKTQKPSSGCNIKWKIGNEPPYFSSK